MGVPSSGTRWGRSARLAGAWLATTALFASAASLPIAGAVFVPFTPQPGLALGRREGVATLALMIGLVGCTLGAFADGSTATAYLATFGALTLALSAVARPGRSVELAVLSPTVVAVVSAGVLVWASGWGPGDLFASLRGALEGGLGRLIAVARNGGASADLVRHLESHGPQVIDAILHLAPALCVITSGTVALLNVLVLRSWQRLGGEAPIFGDLTRWRSPAAIVWVLIASGYAAFVPVERLRWVAVNVLVIVLAIYFWQGMAIIRFYFQKWQVAFWARALAYSFVALEWLVACGVVLLGIFDLWGDFRRLTPRAAEKD